LNKICAQFMSLTNHGSIKVDGWIFFKLKSSQADIFHCTRQEVTQVSPKTQKFHLFFIHE
jgi:hypothetical protein